MMRPGGGSHLPVSIPMNNAVKKERGVSRSAMFPIAEIWIHTIPVLVLLCFFILWLMSRPVNVEIKDGRIIAVHEVEIPLPLSNSHIDVSLLASAASPIASVPQNLTTNETIFEESDDKNSSKEFSSPSILPGVVLEIQHFQALF